MVSSDAYHLGGSHTVGKAQLKVSFLDAQRWKPDYHRNNKQSGAKNLRCFPYCRDPHRKSGFCGQPVAVSISRKDQSKQQELYVWAEFLTVQEFEDKKSCFIGTRLNEEEIEGKTRSRKFPFRSWYAGETNDTENNNSPRTSCDLVFTIKNQKSGWNYMFVGNKHTGKILHCLSVYVFAKVAKDGNGLSLYECVDMRRSPSFKIYSCKRKSRPKSTPKLEAVPKNIICESPKARKSPVRGFSGEECCQESSEAKQPGDVEDYSDLLIPEPEELEASFFKPMFTIPEVEWECPKSFGGALDLEDAFTGQKRMSQDIGGGQIQSRLSYYNMPYGDSVPIRLRSCGELNKPQAFEVPQDVLVLFGCCSDNSNTYEVRKHIWRICIILSVLETHWRSYPELSDVDFEDRKYMKEYDYEDSSIKQAFLQIAIVMGSVAYQSEVFKITTLNNLSVEDKEACYVRCTLQAFAQAISRSDLHLGSFLGLFDMNISQKLEASAVKRLRQLNSFLRTGVPLKGDSEIDSGLINSRSRKVRSFVDQLQEVEIPRPKVRLGFNINGTWEIGEEGEEAMDHIRMKYLKFSWIMRQLWTKVGRRFNLRVQDGSFYVCSDLAGFKHIEVAYKMDGVRRSYFPGKFNFPFIQTLAMEYCCYWEEDSIFFVLYYGTARDQKCVRKYHLAPEENIMCPSESIHTIEYWQIKEGTQEWVQLYQSVSKVTRVSP
mmetsp:Transcript_9689/g.11036  ORF Transcript_9689/g.11036 Transcript_9689/m.11036 type:complete len:714 (+) Transcript_9689:362-2503(+)